MQFYLRKFVIATSIRQQEADTSSREFVVQLILKYGIPVTVLTEKCANFLNKIFKVCKLPKIRKIQTSAFHPESKCGLGRSQCVLTEYMKHYSGEDQGSWDHCIPCATFVYNVTEHVSIWTLSLQTTIDFVYHIIQKSSKYKRHCLKHDTHIFRIKLPEIRTKCVQCKIIRKCKYSLSHLK